MVSRFFIGMKEIRVPYTPRDVQRELHEAMDTHRFCVIVAHRRMGKTVAIINQLIKQATLCEKPNPRFAYIGPFLNQSKDIAWDYLLKYTEPIPGRTKNESELWVKVPSRSGDMARIRIYGADKPETIKGIYLDGCVIDETADCKAHIWTEVVRPLLSDRLGFCIFIGTPKGLSNLFATVHQDGMQDPEWFVKSYPVSQTKLVDQEELDAALKHMKQAIYDQEYECDFTASSDDILIPLRLSEAAAKRENVRHTYSWAPVVIGVDVARFGNDKSAICVRQGKHVISVKSYNKLDTMELADHVAHAIREHNASMTFIDMVGIGSGTLDRLIHLGYKNVMGVNAGFSPDDPKYKNKGIEMWDTAREWLENGGDIPDDPNLVMQLSSRKYFYRGGLKHIESKKDMAKRDIPSPDEAESFVHTFFMEVMQSEWDEDEGGYYDGYQKPNVSSITGY